MAFHYTRAQREQWARDAAAAALLASLATRKKISVALAGSGDSFNSEELYDPEWWDDAIEEYVSPALAGVAAESTDTFARDHGIGLVGLAIGAGLAAVVAGQIDRLSAHSDRVGERVQTLAAEGNAQNWTEDQLAEQLGLDGGPGQLSDALADVMGETLALSTYGASPGEVADAAGLVGTKTWNCVFSNSRASHEEADGSTVGVDESFEIGGWPGMYPGDPDLPDEEMVNCQCFLSYDIVAEQPSQEEGDEQPSQEDSDSTELAVDRRARIADLTAEIVDIARQERMSYARRHPIQFGGEGSGRVVEVGPIGISIKSERLAKLMEVPLHDNENGRPDWENTVSKAEWSSQTSLLVTTVSGVIPGPKLVQAEKLQRQIGKLVRDEVAKRLAERGLPDPVAKMAEADKLTKVGTTITKAEKDANNRAVDDMIGRKYGSIDEAKAAMGSKVYNQLRRDLATTTTAATPFNAFGDPIVWERGETITGGRGVDDPLNPSGGNGSYWPYEPKDLAEARTGRMEAFQGVHAATRQALNAAREWQATARDVLDEARGLNPPDNPLRSETLNGQGRPASAAQKKEATAEWEKVAAQLPKDWIDQSNGVFGGRPLETQMQSDAGRSFASGDGTRISMGRLVATPVWAHELTHRLQSKDPKWLAMDEAFRDRRVGGEAPPPDRLYESPVPMAEATGVTGYSRDEYTKPDDLTSPYMGKVYPTGDQGIPYASEVSSMAVERYVSGGLPLTKTAGGKIDTDFIDYTLGMLAGMGGRQSQDALRTVSNMVKEKEAAKAKEAERAARRSVPK